MNKHKTQEHSQHHPTQPAENSLDIAAGDDMNTDVSSAMFTPETSEPGELIPASPCDGARAHSEGNKFTSNDERTITEASLVAMVRLKSRFMTLDNVIQLYDGFESRFGKPSNHPLKFMSLY